MKKLKALLSAVGLLTVVAATPSLAGSSDFAGPYLGMQAMSAGVELDGKYTDSDSIVTKGSGGRIVQVVGAEVGYNVPLGDTLFVAIGASFNAGKAEISKHDDAADAADVKVEAEDFYTVYISPSISVTESSALFVKIGKSYADLNVTGDFTGSASNELEGETIAIGSRTLFPSGMFFSAEAGLTEYDGISVNDIGNANESTKGDVTADPSIAYGAISIGYKF